MRCHLRCITCASVCAVLWLLAQTPLTRESHSSGVSLKDFYQSKELAAFMNPLTLSLDKEGKVGCVCVYVDMCNFMACLFCTRKQGYVPVRT